MQNSNEKMQKEVEEIIRTAAGPEDAMEKICQAFPEIDRELLKENFEKEKKKAEKFFADGADSEALQTLSEDELEAVAGGSFGSWMKKNWPIVLGAAAFITVGAICLIRGFKKDPNKALKEEVFEEGYKYGYNDTLRTAPGVMKNLQGEAKPFKIDATSIEKELF